MSHPAPGRIEPADDYCVDCGHDQHPNHRGGRCWTDALGNAVERTPTRIACTCREGSTVSVYSPASGPDADHYAQAYKLFTECTGAGRIQILCCHRVRLANQPVTVLRVEINGYSNP